MASPDSAVAVDRRGRTTPLGDFVFGLLADRGMSVSALSREANLSRSFLYLLKDDRQVPSLDTVVALLEAIGVDEVRLAEPGEPGELALTVDGRAWWIRLPATNRRTERSRAAWQALAPASASPPAAASPPPPPPSAPPPRPASAPASRPASSPASAARSYARAPDQPFQPAPTDPRQQQLAELLAAAGGLDAERLALLVEHARLLGRG